MSEQPILEVKGSRAKEWRPARVAVFADHIEVENPGVLGRRTQQVIRFDQISQVDCKKGMAWSTLTISSLGAGQVQVENLPKAEAEQARQMILSKVAEARQPQATAPVAAPTDIADQLGKLAALKDAGVLTDEEFAAQKAKLLG